SRTVWMARAWSAWAPWLKLTRNTSAPAMASSRTLSTPRLAGPRVATMRALRSRIMGRALGFRSQPYQGTLRRGWRIGAGRAPGPDRLTQTLELFPIGNCAASALIDEAGRHVWACAPRVDGDPFFSALLGGKDAAEE